MSLPEIIVTNWHKRYTGVSATIAHIVPHQQGHETIGVLDTGNLDLDHTLSFGALILGGFRPPKHRSHRSPLHASMFFVRN